MRGVSYFEGGGREKVLVSLFCGSAVRKSATKNLWIVLAYVWHKNLPQNSLGAQKMYITFGPEMALNHRKPLTALN